LATAENKLAKNFRKKEEKDPWIFLYTFFFEDSMPLPSKASFKKREEEILNPFFQQWL
jgi:hypothetical protein